MKFFPYLIGLLIVLLSSSLKLDGQISRSIKKEVPPSEVLNPMYLITYDHGGIVPWGVDHFKTYLHTAVDWLDRYPNFKIGLDNEAYAYDYMNRYDTLLLEEVRGYLKKYKGRFGIGSSTYGQPLSQFISGESNIRQIGYAIETEESLFQYSPTVYLMSEHAMHSQIPQILKGFGFSGAIMRTHFMMYGYNPTFNSAIGWWIGMDGSRISTIPTYKGEGNGFGWVTEDNYILTRYPGPECNEPLEAFRKKFSHINPLLATRADDSGLRQEGLVKEYENKPGYKWILADEIFPNFPAPHDEFLTLPNDFHARMPWGYCGNEIWNRSRKAEVNVLTAERLAAMESLAGGENHEDKIHESWENLLIAQHHDIQICGLVNESRKYLSASINLSDGIINASMKYVSSKMEGGDLAQITVFNPLSWTRKEYVETTINVPNNVRFEIKKGNQLIPYEILSSVNNAGKDSTKTKLLIPVEIPALTFYSFSIVRSDQQQVTSESIRFDKKNLQVTTPFWIINLKKEGGILSLVSRSTGTQLFMTEKGRSAYFAGVINGQPIESVGSWDLDSILITNNQLILHEDGTIGAIPYRLEMKLTGFSPRIDFAAGFQFNYEKIGRLSNNKNESASAFLHEKKLRFKIFPATGIGTTGIRDLPFAIAETEEKYIDGNYWSALADGHTGMAFFNKGNMGSVREPDGGFSIPLAYSMYYCWNTVILKGGFSYEFSLYPFEGNWKEADIHKKALEYNFPFISLLSEKGNGSLANQFQPFRISSSDVILSALYTKNGIPFVRFYESGGLKGVMNLNCNIGSCKYTEVDFRGNEIGKKNQNLVFNPWQIKTLKLNIYDKEQSH